MAKDSKWKVYVKESTTEMRPYLPGEDMTGITKRDSDRLEIGGMIARNPKDHTDQWYVGKEYAKNYKLV